MCNAHPLVRELRRRRRANGMSLDAVAAASGLSKTILSEWENGHHEPTLTRFAAYAAAVGAQVALTDAGSRSSQEHGGGDGEPEGGPQEDHSSDVTWYGKPESD